MMGSVLERDCCGEAKVSRGGAQIRRGVEQSERLSALPGGGGGGGEDLQARCGNALDRGAVERQTTFGEMGGEAAAQGFGGTEIERGRERNGQECGICEHFNPGLVDPAFDQLSKRMDIRR
jgi:hypothetical protein